MPRELSTPLRKKACQLYQINYAAQDKEIRRDCQADYAISAMENFLKPIIKSNAQAAIKQLAYVFYSILKDEKLAIIWSQAYYNRLGLLHDLVDFPELEKFENYKSLALEIGDKGDYEGLATDSTITNLYFAASHNFDFIRSL